MVSWKKKGQSVAGQWTKTLVLISLSVTAGAQTKKPGNAEPCSSVDAAKTASGKPCATPKTPSMSEQFPFPGETPDEAKPLAILPAAPAQPPSGPGSESVKDQFPFPGETSESDADAAPKSSAGESSSSSADVLPDVDGKPALKDEGSEGSTARGRRRLRPPAQKILSDDERVEEDLSVAHFYEQTGNLNGAYMRTKDAVKIQPPAADAHRALAETAQKLGKRDEAIAEYTRYLELDPDGDGVKAAKKALERLKP